MNSRPWNARRDRELFGRGTSAPTAWMRRLGPAREVVRLCGGMPLAVCVSAARLAAHPRWPVSRIARELAAEHGRLSALSLDGDLSVRAAFDVSYRALPAGAARAYRMGALIPGPDFCASLAAAVLDDDQHRAGTGYARRRQPAGRRSGRPLPTTRSGPAARPRAGGSQLKF